MNKEREFEWDSATDDRWVKTAVVWLAEATLLNREENEVRAFPSSLRFTSVEEIDKSCTLPIPRKRAKPSCLHIVRRLMNARPDEGILTDELIGASELPVDAYNKAVSGPRVLSVMRNDLAVTVRIHVGVADRSEQRLTKASDLETDFNLLHMRDRA